MNKTAEREFFLKVFGGASWTVVESESPDFLCNRNDAVVLGVEVTELFQNETVARLTKKTDYTIDIIYDGAYIHKDDRELLKVEPVTFRREREGKDSMEWSADGISLIFPSIERRLDLLTSAVQAKESRLDDYRQSAPHVDLVVVDSSRMFSFEQIGRIFGVLRPRPLVSSGFREIYLLTEARSEWVVFPIRLNLYFSELKLVEELVGDWLDENESSSDEDWLDLVLLGMSRLGYGQLQVWQEPKKVCIDFGAFVYSYLQEGVDVLDRTEHPELRSFSTEPRHLAEAAADTEVSTDAANSCIDIVIERKENLFVKCPFVFRSPLGRGFYQNSPNSDVASKEGA